jgi:hypothetical protein
MWASIFWSLVPFAIVATVWGATGDVAVTNRNIVLGCIGAPLGAALLIWVGYLSSATKIVAQTTAAPTATTDASASSNSRSGPVGIQIIGGDKGKFSGNKITVGSMKGVSKALEIDGGNVEDNTFKFGTIETSPPKAGGPK